MHEPPATGLRSGEELPAESAAATAFRLSAAVAAHRSGDLVQARALYETVLRGEPHQPDALNLLGLIEQQNGDLGRARALIEASVEARPAVAATRYNLAIVQGAQGDAAGAIASYEAAVALLPSFAEAHGNLGNLYVAAGRRHDALRAYAAAVAAKPDAAAFYSNLATVLIDLERYDEAIRTLRRALELAPDLPEAHANLGQALRRSGRFREALAASARALELRPGYREAYLNAALAASDLDETELALGLSRQALERFADDADTQCNGSRVYFQAGRYADAIHTAEAALALRPAYAEAHVNLSLSLLASGELGRGWEEYVWMWRVPARRARYPYLDRVPLWNGEPFAGRRLLIAPDQGFGDALQFVRYLPAVKARGGHVILETPAALAPLLHGLDGVDELRISTGDGSIDPSVELHVPLLGLPRAFRTDLASIPASPYLYAPPDRVERWRARLTRPETLRVGIVWSGNPEHATDHHRSARLEDFAPLGSIAGIAWFSLQKGPGSERRSSGPLAFEPLGGDIADFGDTAAILAQLDLLVSVDTAAVHVAGAIGTPVWTLLPFASDWRWLTGRTDSPWYRTMRLFRQPRPGAWAPVFAEVARALQSLVAARSGCVLRGGRLAKS